MPPEAPDRIILTADVGGTNLTLAMVARRGGRFDLLRKWRGATHGETSLGAPLARFLEDCKASGCPGPPAMVSISAAGPLLNRRIGLTNAPWDIDARTLEAALDLPVLLMNDFTAVSYGVLLLDLADRMQVEPLPHPEGGLPPVDATAPVLIVGAGTGLGVGFVTRTGGIPRAYSSEGGHVALPVLDEETMDLWQHLRAGTDSLPDAECAVSGPGIAAIHAFLLQSGRVPATATGDRILALPAGARPAEIAANADLDAGCGRAMDLFVDLYARVASELATVFLPTGGLFLAGGIAAKNASRFLDGQRFMRGFGRNCRPHIDGILRATPVFMVRDYAISLYGAAHAACLALDAASHS